MFLNDILTQARQRRASAMPQTTSTPTTSTPTPAPQWNALNSLFSGMPNGWSGAIGGTPYGQILGQGLSMADQKWRSTPMLQAVGGMLNRLMGLGGKSWSLGGPYNGGDGQPPPAV